MSDFLKMVNEVCSGKDVSVVVESHSGPVGTDRSDDSSSSPEKWTATFRDIAGTIAQYKGYVGPDWITKIGDQLKSGDRDTLNDLMNMAHQNRDMYVGTAKVDQDGCWEMWDKIYRGLLAVRTEQLPPPSPAPISSPNLA